MKRARHIGFVALMSFLLAACAAGDKTQATSKKEKTEDGRESVAFQEHFFAAMNHRNNGEEDKAYRQFSKCKELNPKNGAVHYEMARIDFVSNRKEEALAGIAEAIKLEPDNYWYRKTHAAFLLEYAMYAEAEKELKWVLDNRPDDLEAYYDLASTFLYREDGKGALEAYDKLESKMGVLPDIIFQKQRIHLIMGNTDAALADMDRLIEAFPDEPSFYGEKANLLFDLGRNDAAKAALEELLEKDPENGMAHLQLSRLYAAQGRDELSWQSLQFAFKDPRVSIDEKVGILLKYFDLALGDMRAQVKTTQLLKSMEEAHPNDPRTHSLWGDYLVQDGKYTEARDRFALATTFDASKPLIWQQLISLDGQIRDWPAMLEHAADARSIFPSQPEFYLMEGNALLRNNKAEDAVRTLNTGKAFVIENPDLMASYWSSLGEAYNETKEFSKSDEAFEKSIELFNNDPFVFNNYSYYLSVRNTKLDRAAELSLKSNELLPGTSSFQDTYGWILFQKGEYAEALTWLNKARSSGGENDPTILEHTGDVLFHLDRKSEAVEYWLKAKSQGGNSPLLLKKITDSQYYAE